ncbi:MAG: lysogenization regulator HflD [Desulfosudis oleivorans]|nr:lysogenization regulator HflD [Desulfosudis oleivorans]
MVQQLAREGRSDPGPFRTSVRSILAIDAADVGAVYGELSGLRSGLTLLQDKLSGRSAPSDVEMARYVVAILHLRGGLAAQPGDAGGDRRRYRDRRGADEVLRGRQRQRRHPPGADRQAGRALQPDPQHPAAAHHGGRRARPPGKPVDRRPGAPPPLFAGIRPGGPAAPAGRGVAGNCCCGAARWRGPRPPLLQKYLAESRGWPQSLTICPRPASLCHTRFPQTIINPIVILAMPGFRRWRWLRTAAPDDASPWPNVLTSRGAGTVRRERRPWVDTVPTATRHPAAGAAVGALLHGSPESCRTRRPAGLQPMAARRSSSGRQANPRGPGAGGRVDADAPANSPVAGKLIALEAGCAALRDGAAGCRARPAQFRTDRA